MSSPADGAEPAEDGAEPAEDGRRTEQGAENLVNEVGRVAKRFRAFLAAHGTPGTAVVSYLGRPGARVVVVAADGSFADAVVSDLERGAAVCAAADLTVTDWDRGLTSRVTVSPADRARMAGTGR